MSREFKLATYQFECDALAYWDIHKTLYNMWQSYREMTREFAKGGGLFCFEITQTSQCCFHSIWTGTC